MSKKFGSDLRAVRKRLGINRAKMAALVGVSEDTIRNYERGTSKPSALAARALAEFAEGIKGAGRVA